MSYGLPPSTDVNIIIAKDKVIERYGLTGKDRTGFNDAIHRITICNEISPRTVNIPPGEIKSIFVLRVELRKRSCNPHVLQNLFDFIGQKMIMVLEYGIIREPVTFYDTLIKGEWNPDSELSLSLNGLDLDHVWENLVIQVGHIDVVEGRTLSEQIVIDEQVRATNEKIAELTKKMMTEKQPSKKRELFEEINKLKRTIKIE